jgi:hypothetical protein
MNEYEKILQTPYDVYVLCGTSADPRDSEPRGRRVKVVHMQKSGSGEVVSQRGWCSLGAVSFGGWNLKVSLIR